VIASARKVAVRDHILCLRHGRDAKARNYNGDCDEEPKSPLAATGVRDYAAAAKECMAATASAAIFGVKARPPNVVPSLKAVNSLGDAPDTPGFQLSRDRRIA